MDKYEKEYDSFGPWIMPVREADEVPDAFIDRFSWNDSVDLAYKIPRDVERRKVRSGDHLYDYLVVLYADRLELYSRFDGDDGPVGAPYSGIQGIVKMIELLRGELRLDLGSQVVTIPFNSVSEEIVDDMISVIRGRYTANAPHPLPAAKRETPPLSQFYSNLLKKEQRREPVYLVAYQPPLRTEKRNRTIWNRIEAIYARWTLRESMAFLGERELFFYRSVPSVVWRPKGYYGYEWVALPRVRLTGVSIDDNPVFQDVKRVSVIMDGGSVVFDTGENAAEAIMDALES